MSDQAAHLLGDGRAAGPRLCGAPGEPGQHAEDADDGVTQSRSAPLRAAP